MGRIVVSENVSLDGVVQDPIGDEGFGRGGWFAAVSDRDRQAFGELATAEAMACEALLVGRGTHRWFAERWPARSGPWADRLNSLPKYVVGSALDEPRWHNSTVIGFDEIADVKRRSAGDILVYGSSRLVHTLIERDLADELRLLVYPFVIGAGDRLFGETSGSKPLRLAGNRSVGDSLVLLTYQLSR